MCYIFNADMIFMAICIAGFLFVCCALPFALRYESHRKKLARKTGALPSPDDPQLGVKCPGHPLLYQSPWHHQDTPKD
jgi:hypothetical protein